MGPIHIKISPPLSILSSCFFPSDLFASPKFLLCLLFFKTFVAFIWKLYYLLENYTGVSSSYLFSFNHVNHLISIGIDLSLSIMKSIYVYGFLNVDWYMNIGTSNKHQNDLGFACYCLSSWSSFLFHLNVPNKFNPNEAIMQLNQKKKMNTLRSKGQLTREEEWNFELTPAVSLF